MRPGSAARAAANPEVARRIVTLAGGRTLAYAEVGAGPPLVAIHGALMLLEDFWLGPVPALARHFRVIVVDRPGHGHSQRLGAGDASLWRQAALIREAMDAIGLERPVVVGHSFGAAVALAYAMDAPEAVAGAVALAPICVPEPRLEHALFGPRALPPGGPMLSEALGATLDPALMPMLWRALFLPQAMPAAMAAGFPFALAKRPAELVATGEDAVQLWPDLSRSLARYPGCRPPVRILGGTADLVVNNLLHGRLAANLIPGARFDWIPGAGHMLHHFHAEAVVAAARSVAGL